MNIPFRKWLEIKYHKYLDELQSSECHKLFREFVKSWNSGNLPVLLYELGDSQTNSSTVLSQPRMTKHKWSFANLDKAKLDETIKQVKEETSSRDQNGQVIPTD